MTLLDSAAKRDLPTLVKLINNAVQEADPSSELLIGLYLNRGACYQYLGVLKKALKDYEAILETRENHPEALLNAAKIHLSLKAKPEAKRLLQLLLSTATPSTPLTVIFEAQYILQGIEDTSIPSGAKFPAFPPLPNAPPLPIVVPPPTTPHSPPAIDTNKSIVVDSPATTTTTTTTTTSTDGEDDLLSPIQKLMIEGDPNEAVNYAIELVNSNQYTKALALADGVLTRHGPVIGAYVAKGTANALLGNLKEAVLDFSHAIALEPNHYDFYKRRAQALRALGLETEALADFWRVLSLCVDHNDEKVEALTEVSRMYQKRKDYVKASKAASAGLSIAPTNKTLLSSKASSALNQGELQEAIDYYLQVLQHDPADKDAALGVGMAYKELCNAQSAKLYLEKAIQLGKTNSSSSNISTTVYAAYKLLAQLHHGLGDDLAAIAVCSRLLKKTNKVTDPQRLEFLFMRGSYYHTIGMLSEACKDYQDALEITITEATATELETIQHMCLSFYQKELALWAQSRLHLPMIRVSLDRDLLPEFKELWSKKCPPPSEFVALYQQKMLTTAPPDWSAHNHHLLHMSDGSLKALVDAADALGSLVQYKHQGFLPNKRHHRMAGLAAIEFAQTLSALVSNARENKPIAVPNQGASVAARSSVNGTHAFGWRDAMDIIVKWRQLAEPNDQVIWVDLLTEQEFNSGFGSHTPMFTGQTKCIRYHMNFDRALKLAKEVVVKEKQAMDVDNKPIKIESVEALDRVKEADSAKSYWEAIGKDSWVVAPIESTMRKGHVMEGTRLTVVKIPLPSKNKMNDGQAEEELGKELQDILNDPNVVPQPPKDVLTPPDSYEFSIRTPVTPDRWKDFDIELDGIFTRLIQCLQNKDMDGAVEYALKFVYYWYNFMPLARGSALCGYVALMGVLLLVGAINDGSSNNTRLVSMPQNYQADWEAILDGRAEGFMASVRAWVMAPQQGDEDSCTWPSVTTLPIVEEALKTRGDRTHVLNAM